MTSEATENRGPFSLHELDPLSPEAVALLQEAALAARQLYPEYHDPTAPEPTNRPVAPRGLFLVAFAEARPVGMGGHWPLDDETTEIRRLFVARVARRQGIARALLERLETHARAQGFRRLVLETGHRQLPAIALYHATGFTRVPAFGAHVNDPTSVCFAKALRQARSKA